MATVLTVAFLRVPFQSRTSQLILLLMASLPKAMSLMAKFDVASAYRNPAIYPLDHPLLRMKWQEKYYVDMALLLGLWSVPYIFTAIADMVQWLYTYVLMGSSMVL